jgi:hypothetical protein
MRLEEVDTFSDLKEWASESMPGAEVYQDMHGNIVIHTGLMQSMGGYIHPVGEEGE